MAKKKRGQPKSKRPRLTLELPSGEMTTLEADTDYFCITCDVSVSRRGLDSHFEGRRHKNMEKIELYYSFLQQHGLSWMPGRRGFRCDRESCLREDLPARYEELEIHVFKKHFSHLRPTYPHVASQVYVGGIQPQVIYAEQGVKQTQKYWKTFDVEARAAEYKKVSSPATILSHGTRELMVLLVNGEFSEDDLELFTTWGRYLAQHGEPVRKQKTTDGFIKGTKMMCVGMKCLYGKIGRYIELFPLDFIESFHLFVSLFIPDSIAHSCTHSCRFRQKKAPLCYILGENLAHRLHVHLQRLFPSIFRHLEMVRSKELMPDDVGRLAGSPFTGMSVTLDYSCRAHLDDDDVSYCFIVWLGSAGEI
jgi:hypothetical protein